ncbi:MAG: phosphoribosylaminoimidazolesuccinocarboxamide synthase [Nitrospirae bacterium]|nr:phosphoribosylaminoimidazolesuccinocarboxamide synthase [Nitrospirota bacterium]
MDAARAPASNLNGSAVLYTDIPGGRMVRRGKVRDIYDAGEHLLLVATDRISAFDVVMPNGIPDKGRVLTQISAFWFEKTRSIVPNHLVSTEPKDFPAAFKTHQSALARRSMLVRRATPLPVECIVRGYLSGSGWADYQKTGAVCGIALPKGLVESQKLPEPIFTPSTKADEGHDINIPFEEAVRILGDRRLAERVRATSIRIYESACRMAEVSGLIISDTKFEFGLLNGEVVLIDEILTPDSSRFWPKAEYEPGRAQRSFDKQFVRDYLNTLTWDKRPPGPVLPAEIVEKTREKYLEAYRILTGRAD